jgi:ADP-ribosylglycohydrolase
VKIDARGGDSERNSIRRPIENSYVVPESRLVAGEYPGNPPSTPQAKADGKLAKFLDAGISVFIDLTAPKDELAPYEAAMRAQAKRRGIEMKYEHFPIPDMNVCDDQKMCDVLDAIDEHLAVGRTVYVHCWGGVGRTGTVVGCWLVRHGKMGKEALGEVSRLFATMSKDKTTRHAMLGSLHTEKQREMVREWPESIMFRLTTAKSKEARRRRLERRGPSAEATTPVRTRMSDPVAQGEVKDPPAYAGDEDDDQEHDDGDDLDILKILEEDEAVEAASMLEDRRLRAGNARAIQTRIRGCLLGGALGDALGWPVEFMSLAAIRERYGAVGIENPLISAAGVAEITDDTQMTLFTAEGVLRSTTRYMEHWAYREPTGMDWRATHTPHIDVMRLTYLRWLATQQEKFSPKIGPARGTPYDALGFLHGIKRLYVRRAPGNTCLSALEGPTAGTVEAPLNNSKGCGGVMRVAPIGLVPCEDPFAYAVMAAAITHGHPSGYLSAGAYAQILSNLLFDSIEEREKMSLRDSVEAVLPRLTKETGHEETLAALEGALELAARDGEPSAERVESLGAGGTGEEALAIGVYCAIVANDFDHGVRLAVNHSGDSDSTGSITGALLGVQFGEYGLPREWLARLELRDVISEMARDLLVGYGGGIGWREKYPGV